MRNLLTASLPGLALLALGGCATSGALTTTTESDGAYYTSADQTTATPTGSAVYANRGYSQPYAPQQSVAGSANPDGFQYNAPTTASGQSLSTAENANPDYAGGTGYATEGYNTSTLGASSDYYATQISSNPSGFGVPYTGPGVSSYNYAPAVSVAPSFYGSPFGYGLGLSLGFGYGGFGGYGYPYGGFYSPYAYSAFYDPFYSPFGYGGYGLGYGYGYGYPYGFGGFGYPYSSFGYGGYGYGGYGYGGYGAYRTGSLAPGSYATESGGRFLSGPRVNRGGMLARASAINPAQPTGSGAPGTVGNNIMAGRRGGYGPAMSGTAPGMPGNPMLNQQVQRRGAFANGGAIGQPTTAAPGAVPSMQPARRGFFSGFLGNGTNGGQPAMNQGGYAGQAGQAQGSNMSRRGGFNQGGFNGGQMQQRSFSQPSMAPQRSFSQPSMAPQRSFGGGGGGSFGGGSFGGGGGGRRGGR